jgi:hypothetical protein
MSRPIPGERRHTLSKQASDAVVCRADMHKNANIYALIAYYALFADAETAEDGFEEIFVIAAARDLAEWFDAIA